MERMKETILCSGIDRRTLLSALALLLALYAPPLSVAASAQTASSGTLTSWNEGSAKQAMLDLVRDTTDPANPKLVPPEQRIAPFDQDGTLWVEHPIYCQVMYCLDRVPVLAAQQPALRELEPFKTVLSMGARRHTTGWPITNADGRSCRPGREGELHQLPGSRRNVAVSGACQYG
jgi:hypothetical protein